MMNFVMQTILVENKLIKKLPVHLGGHCNITHIDEASLDYLISKYSIRSLYDLGCGPGGMVKLANSKKIKSTGIDGDFTIKYRDGLDIITHDFTKGALDLESRDLCWSCEFLEHVEEKYMDNYFSVFNKSKVVFCTYSLSRGGHHHVNVKNQDYWDKCFAERMFTKDLESTEYVRKNSSMSRNFVRNTGTVYINNRKL